MSDGTTAFMWMYSVCMAYTVWILWEFALDAWKNHKTPDAVETEINRATPRKSDEASMDAESKTDQSPDPDFVHSVPDSSTQRELGSRNNS